MEKKPIKWIDKDVSYRFTIGKTSVKEIRSWPTDRIFDRGGDCCQKT